MSDELDDLKAAMTAATPRPDAARKAADLRLAEENFVRFQGSPDLRRPMSERGPMARLGQGVKAMMTVMTTRAGLTATTGLVAVGLVMILPVGRDLLSPPVELVEPGTVVVTVDEDGQVLEERTIGPALGNESVSDLVRERPLSAEAEVAEALDFAPDVSVAQQRAEGQALGKVASAPQAERLIIADDIAVAAESDTEVFSNAAPSSLKVTVEEPVSTFSIDVDTASYAIVRSSLTRGMLPPEEAVRVEEMVNYFPYAYPQSDGPDPFEPTITVMSSPWNAGTNLVHIGIQGDLPAIADRPPLNLVFLIDTSGSMQDANKLPLLKQSFRMMLAELRPEDEVSIV
ncbi:MAG: VWA domain-containing protein, partial [Boseongicola sp.]|nr:VWA domain-containing protein [Boseongicola sp.]